MPDPTLWGIDRGYWDAAGSWHDAPAATVDAFLAAMDAGEGAPHPGPTVFAGPDGPANTDGSAGFAGVGHLELEDGGEVAVEGGLPAGLPFGYHRFVPADGGPGRPVIVTPGRCRLPGRRRWGWAAQLYAARSADSWGMGDLGDLRRLAAWSDRLGAGALLVNPLHAALPGPVQEPSPYSPSSRCFRNPLYLRIEDIPGASGLAGLAALGAAGRALNDDRHIDRDAIWRLKSPALRSLFASFGTDAGFERYRREQGGALAGYATFCALAERHGLPWRAWPVGLRRPDSPAVAAFAATAEGAAAICFHEWLQWLLEGQLAAASGPLDLVHDLAIGVHPDGADAWLWQDCFALGARVGAPPDEFNTMGQAWGIPPFDPWRLRAAGYEPYIRTVRAGLRHAGGLRVDHVMGLFRLFWIPEGGTPSDGTYVRYPWSDLLDILALESHRAGAYVLGEDLGTVEDFAREELARRAVLSYRLLWFEPDAPDSGRWPERALAAVTTHDLPTVAGLWSGSDLAAQQRLGLAPNEGATLAIRDKVAAWTGTGPSTPVAEVIERVYRLLGRAPCLLVAATLDDALAVEERPNMPGTVGSWPNWSVALPRPLEELEQAGLALAIAAALNEEVGGPTSGPEVGGPTSGTEVGGPTSGTEVEGPTSGTEVEGPTSGTEVEGPTSGTEVGGPTSTTEGGGPSSST